MREHWKNVPGQFALGLLLLCGTARADSAADVLMKTVKPQGVDVSGGATTSKAVDSPLYGDVKLNDPFQMQFFSLWQAETNLPYDVNAWAGRVLKGEYVDAAHLWSSVQAKLPGSFEPQARAAYTYLLWKIEVPQTFFDQWVTLLGNPKFTESRIGIALDQTISPGFDEWLGKNVVSVSPEQESVLKGLDPAKSMLYSTLRGWTLLRKGKQALPVLERLPITHRLKIPLAQTVALDMARHGDLSGAAQVLKKHLEPAMEAKGDPKALAAHYIQIARLLYQAGSLDGAESFYLKVPRSAPEFLNAREELTWVSLRKGDAQKLRGELETLNSGMFVDRFAPDVYVVRSISNLKLCYYDEAEKNVKAFVADNAGWAKTISQALKASDPPAPDKKDYFSELADQMLEKRLAEAARLEKLGKESIGASLPAVGPQNHWVKARDRILAEVELAKKHRADEYRRQWKNSKSVLNEAIQKMQFVKVELLSQIRALARQDSLDYGSHSAANADTTATLASAKKAKLTSEGNGEVIFPFDGVVWPDEMFKLRSVAQAKCLQAVNK